MLGRISVSGSPIPRRGNEGPALNDGQSAAVASSIGHDLTAIWGPPGTGKTTTIGEIVMNLFWADRSVLIVFHTNTAVDQAILKAAKAKGMEEHLPSGAVVRVGQVLNKELTNQYPDVLIKTQIDHKSEGLLAERETLAGEKSQLEIEVHHRRARIEMCEWVPTGRADLNRLESVWAQADQADLDVDTLLAEDDSSADKRAELKEEHRRLTRLLELRKALESETSNIDPLRYEVRHLTSWIPVLEHTIEVHAERMETAERIDPLRKERLTYSSPAEQKRIISELNQSNATRERELREFQTELTAQQSILAEANMRSGIVRVFKRLPDKHLVPK